jgi:hypothetical protein
MEIKKQESDIFSSIKTFLKYKYLILVDGDNAINKLLPILFELDKDLGSVHIIIFVSLSASKNKKLSSFSETQSMSIVKTNVDGANSVDLYMTLFCGRISNFDNCPTIGIVTEDHFGPNLTRLLESLNVSSVFILPIDLEKKKSEEDLLSTINTSTRSLQSLWRGKWLQSMERFSEIFKLDKQRLRSWYENNQLDEEIIRVVSDFVFEKTEETVIETSGTELTDDFLREFYKNNWNDTHAQFCRTYGSVLCSNFSRWLSGKMKFNTPSRNAVIQYYHNKINKLTS